MAKIFLDANFFIDLVEKRAKIDIKKFKNHQLYISPLSIHILTYLYKYKIPNKSLRKLKDFFTIVSFDQKIVEKSLQGPTSDFEDNIQLHSSANANCDFLLTQDKKLLNMKFFGKAKLISSF